MDLKKKLDYIFKIRIFNIFLNCRFFLKLRIYLHIYFRFTHIYHGILARSNRFFFNFLKKFVNKKKIFCKKKIDFGHILFEIGFKTVYSILNNF